MLAYENTSMERHNGSDHSNVSYLYGLETSDEKEYKMGFELLDVWRYLVRVNRYGSEID